MSRQIERGAATECRPYNYIVGAQKAEVLTVEGLTKKFGARRVLSNVSFTLAEPVSGKVGVWSKTDSVSYFDQYTVTK